MPGRYMVHVSTFAYFAMCISGLANATISAPLLVCKQDVFGSDVTSHFIMRMERGMANLRYLFAP